MTTETRIFPQCCTSAFCGETDCPESCRSLPTLKEFREWKERTKATRPDHIWSPSVWVGQKD